MNVMIYSTYSGYLGYVVYGGAEVAFMMIAERLAAQGINVVYATHGFGLKDCKKTKTVNGVKVYFFNPVLFPAFKIKYLRKLKMLFSHLQLQWFLAKVAKKENIDVVHTYNEFPNTYTILKVKEKNKLNFKTVLRIAGLYWYKQSTESENAKARIDYVFNHVDLLNFISPGMVEMFDENTARLGFNITKPKRSVFDIGFNSKDFNKRWQVRNSDKFVLTMVGRFAEYAKRQDILIDALKRLNNEKIILQFVGSGPKEEELKQKVTDIGLEKQVRFLGLMEHDKLSEVLIETDLFCLASDHEGLCKSVLEAMSMGVPCLVSDVQAMNSYVVHNQNGLLCKNTVEDWKNAILAVYDKQIDIQKISKNAFDFVQANFNPDKNINIYIDEFKALI
jgi:glycosyltransferase involved in cell wall biosynthesis